ncbi:MAG: hypothetical protein IJY20_05205 [Clostridia bacterium]|nr:hypothetical protein [Clostridia bacterium]
MIIFIEDKPEEVLDTRIQFYRMGIHSITLGTNELHRILHYPAQIILIMRPECIEDLTNVCRKIKSHSPFLPLAMMYRPPNGNYYAYQQLCDAVFEDNVTTLTFAQTMFAIYEERMKKSAEEHSYGKLYMKVNRKGLQILGESLPATHEQWMLARYLLLSAPYPVSREELRLTCFCPDKLPSLQNVTTQICRMNRMITKAFRHPLFFYQRQFGYYISPV